MHKLNLDVIDVDGAIAEQADAVRNDTRLDFLRKGALGAGAAVSGGALLSGLLAGEATAATNTRPPRSFGKGDIGILNFALTLEYLEAAFYTEAKEANASSNFLNGDPALNAFLNTVERDERAHVKFLKQALGAKAVKKPKFDFMGTNKVADKFRATAQVLENTGVSAYLGQAKNINSKTILGAAGSILTIEARHASVIGFLNNTSSKGIAPDGAFDRPKSAAAILKAVGATDFIVS